MTSERKEANDVVAGVHEESNASSNTSSSTAVLEVSGLPVSTTSLQLIEHLRRLADHLQPRDVEVQADGVARAAFETKEQVQEALQALHGSLFEDKNKLEARIVQDVKLVNHQSKKLSSRSVVVSKLPSHLDMAEVTELAKAFGTVVSVRDKIDDRDEEKQKSRSLLITFSTEGEAQEAVNKMDKVQLGDSLVEAELHFVDETDDDEEATTDDNDEGTVNTPTTDSNENKGEGLARRSYNGSNRGTTNNRSNANSSTGGRRGVNASYGSGRPSLVMSPFMSLANGQHESLPLRMLVASDVVGAIIGKGGATIKHISQITKARVDVNRKETLISSLPEKLVTISGPLESCSKACIEIMKIVRAEESNNNSSVNSAASNNNEIQSSQSDADTFSNQQGASPLKIVAHNNLIGRIIGKQGATIKKIMETSGAKVSVSSVNEMNSFSMERVITIAGEMDALAKAEIDVSTRMRAAYEHDLHNIQNNAQQLMFSGLGLPHSTTANNGSGNNANSGTSVGNNLSNNTNANGSVVSGNRSSSVGNVFGAIGLQHQFQALAALNGGRGYDSSGFLGGFMQPGLLPAHIGNGSEKAVLFVPRTAVGALIGAKGNHIKHVIKVSGASIKIAQNDVNDDDNHITFNNTRANENLQDQRRVTITGTPEAQWRAQFLLFEKLREEYNSSGTNSGRRGLSNDTSMDGVDFCLTLEILVPSSQVGRVIGRGGHRVRELQTLTGATIHLPEQGSHMGEETPVHVIGAFLSVQSAQRHLRALTASRGGPGSKEGEGQNLVLSSSE